MKRIIVSVLLLCLILTGCVSNINKDVQTNFKTAKEIKSGDEVTNQLLKYLDTNNFTVRTIIDGATDTTISYNKNTKTATFVLKFLINDDTVDRAEGAFSYEGKHPTKFIAFAKNGQFVSVPLNSVTAKDLFGFDTLKDFIEDTKSKVTTFASDLNIVSGNDFLTDFAGTTTKLSMDSKKLYVKADGMTYTIEIK